MKAKAPEKYRLTVEACVRRGYPTALGSDELYGMNGMFFVPYVRVVLKVVVSDGAEAENELGQWEHVSVSLSDRCPTWEEMCYVKDLFFNEDEPVMQLHPPKSDYVNNHRYCLHLWRPKVAVIPLPPSILVGIKGLSLKT